MRPATAAADLVAAYEMVATGYELDGLHPPRPWPGLILLAPDHTCTLFVSRPLPADEAFPTEMAALDGRVVELGRLAGRLAARQLTAVASRVTAEALALGADHLVAMACDRHAGLYQRLFAMRRLARIDCYEAVGREAVLLCRSRTTI